MKAQRTFGTSQSPRRQIIKRKAIGLNSGSLLDSSHPLSLNKKDLRSIYLGD